MKRIATKESQLSPFFKYFAADGDVIRGIFLDGRIRFTQPAALNDPLEFNPVIRSRQSKGNYTRYVFDGIPLPDRCDWIYYWLILPQVDNFGILSLTTDPDKFDMWSRYASGHQGFLIEFKDGFNQYPCMRGRNGEVYDIREVNYTPDYAYDIEDLVDEHNEIHPDVLNARMFITKSARWGNESEWRMVRPLADHKWWHPMADFAHRDREKYLFPFSLDCVQSVTFGACMSPQNRRKISDACRGAGIQFLQAMIVKDESDSCGHQGIVMRNRIRDVEALHDLPDTGLMFDGGHDKMSKPPTEIQSLSELPYYVGSEDQVQQYYQRAKSEG
jgi:hypothetical protein